MTIFDVSWFVADIGSSVMDEVKKWRQKSDVASDFGCCTRTLDRWVQNERLGFPRPFKINGRIYFDADALREWKEKTLREAMKAVA